MYFLHSIVKLLHFLGALMTKLLTFSGVLIFSFEKMKFRYPRQWRIQDFSEGVQQLPKVLLFFKFFVENCMKMKEFEPPGGRASLAPLSLDPPMLGHDSGSKWLPAILWL